MRAENPYAQTSCQANAVTPRFLCSSVAERTIIPLYSRAL